MFLGNVSAQRHRRRWIGRRRALARLGLGSKFRRRDHSQENDHRQQSTRQVCPADRPLGGRFSTGRARQRRSRGASPDPEDQWCSRLRSPWERTRVDDPVLHAVLSHPVRGSLWKPSVILRAKRPRANNLPHALPSTHLATIVVGAHNSRWRSTWFPHFSTRGPIASFECESRLDELFGLHIARRLRDKRGGASWNPRAIKGFGRTCCCRSRQSGKRRPSWSILEKKAAMAWLCPLAAWFGSCIRAIPFTSSVPTWCSWAYDCRSAPADRRRGRVALLCGLGGYTLLLATTACVLIRLGNLWDDLRSLLLLIVMILMAMAMSGDDVMAADAGKGALVCVGGFLFATVRLRSRPARHSTSPSRLVSHGLLPDPGPGVSLSSCPGPILDPAGKSRATVGALCVLTAGRPRASALIPAARAGRAHVARNGSPWRWPLYPWSLFVVMATWSGRPLFHALCFVSLRRGTSHDLRALFSGPDRAGGQPGVARDRYRIGPEGGDVRGILGPALPCACSDDRTSL